MIKEKKINLNLVVIYYTQINLFLYIHFPVTVADVDILVEMGGVEPPSENTDHLTFYKLSLLLNLTGDWLGDTPVRPRVW